MMDENKKLRATFLQHDVEILTREYETALNDDTNATALEGMRKKIAEAKQELADLHITKT